MIPPGTLQGDGRLFSGRLKQLLFIGQAFTVRVEN